MAAGLCRILFPVDFSNRFVLAARHVKTWADKLGAVLNTLHVVDPKEFGYSHERYYDVISNPVVKRMADLKHFSDHYSGENLARHTLVTGDAPAQIESFAKREKVDLIMLPRTHQGIGSRLLRDSLTATILEKSSASLWITEHVEAVNKLSVDRILCAVHFERDLTLDSQNYRILQKVLALVKVFRAKVTFLNVIDSTRRRNDSTSRRCEFVFRNRTLANPSARTVRKCRGVSKAKGRRRFGYRGYKHSESRRPRCCWTHASRTFGLGVQGRILKIDDAAHRPILSVW
jgi:nucleotide-binding universal stress UspA family protein